jgi:dTDP-4-amino-4,6-dideoxygalactose transaminase
MRKLGFREWFAAGGAIAGGDLLRASSKRQYCARFEAELANLTGAKFALTVNSGTSALVCALQAVGIGPGDEVLVPAYTWMATAAAPLLVGAVPLLVEVDESLTLDPIDMSRKITERTRAVIPVHMLNRPCDMTKILKLAKQHQITVVEDACQAVGIRYKGQACGTMGDVGAFSFNQYKNMTAGEGGAVLTNNNDIFSRLYNAHDLGMAYRSDRPATNAPEHFVGGNYKLSEIQGAILRVQLQRLPGYLAKLERRATLISNILTKAGLTVAPHHDPDQCFDVVVTFENEAQASNFAAYRGVSRLYDNSKHVYTEWSPILMRRMASSKFDPWAWAEQGARSTSQDINQICPRTLDLLRRSCRVDPMAQWPIIGVHAHMKMIMNSFRKSDPANHHPAMVLQN